MFKNFAKNSAEKVYKYFGSSSGKMLLATSIIGISTSCLAQTVAIISNKNYTLSQKAFMVPQELVEGMITVFSIFAITKPIQKFTGKIISSGKLASKNMAEYMKNNGLLEKRGLGNFNLKQSINEVVEKIEQSDKFINSNQIEKEKMLAEHKNALNDYEKTLDAASAIATTAGSIVSTVMIAPVLRNQAASSYQNININLINNMQEKKLKNAQNPIFKSVYGFGNIGKI